MRNIAISVIGVFTLSACAGGMSKNECLYADWQAVGYEDGSRGLPASAVGSHRQACANKAGVTPDMTAYLAGREEGLEQFCTPSKGYDFGLRGGHYTGVCQGKDEAAFIAAFEDGLELYQLRANLRSANAALASAEQALSNTRHRIGEVEAALISPLTPPLARVDLLVELKQLHEREKDIERSIPALLRDRDYAAAELEDYRYDQVVEREPRGTVRPTSASYPKR